MSIQRQNNVTWNSNQNNFLHLNYSFIQSGVGSGNSRKYNLITEIYRDVNPNQAICDEEIASHKTVEDVKVKWPLLGQGKKCVLYWDDDK